MFNLPLARGRGGTRDSGGEFYRSPSTNLRASAFLEAGLAVLLLASSGAAVEDGSFENLFFHAQRVKDASDAVFFCFISGTWGVSN